MSQDADDLPAYLQPWRGILPADQLQRGGQAAREHQAHQRAQEDRPPPRGDGHPHQGHGQDRADTDTPGDDWGQD